MAQIHLINTYSQWNRGRVFNTYKFNIGADRGGGGGGGLRMLYVHFSESVLIK